MPTINESRHRFFAKSHFYSQNVDKISFKDKNFKLHELHFECLSIYQIFKANQLLLKPDSEIVLYLNDLCQLLIQYYQQDYVEAELQAFRAKQSEIARFIYAKPLEDKILAPLAFRYRVQQDIGDFLASISSSAKTRNIVSKMITNRSYWNYSRAWAYACVRYLQKSILADLIQTINQSIGFNSTPEEVIQFLEKPQVILRFLSFSLYGFRLSINIITIIKHVAEAAKNEKLSAKKVLLQELNKRWYIIANDGAWTIVNLLSNYYQLFQIPVQVIGPLNFTFLTVDALLLTASWYVEYIQYKALKQQLTLSHKQSLGLETSSSNRQLDILQDNWEAQSAYYIINIIAAVLLVAAFAATLWVSGPFMLAFLAGCCMLGNALYNTCEGYKKYIQAKVVVKREITNGTIVHDNYHLSLLKEVKNEHQQAQRQFWKTLTFNTGFTSFIIMAATISWPIAGIIGLSYLGYKFYDNYYQAPLKTDKQAVQRIYRLFPSIQTVTPEELDETRTIFQSTVKQ